jgi:hypothetical protein
MNPEQIVARQALRAATLAVQWADNDWDRALAKHARAIAARVLRTALNVERVPAFLRRQAGPLHD